MSIKFCNSVNKVKIVFFPFILLFATECYGGAHSPKQALLIGISNYQQEWKPISSTRDIDSIELALIYRGFRTNGITKLLDSAATKKRVLAALEALINRSMGGDVVYIHFSGHGQQLIDLDGDEADGLDESLVMYDGPTRYKEGYNLSGHLTDDEFGIYLKRLASKIGKYGQLIVVLDASHTGPDDDNIVENDQIAIESRGGFLEVFNQAELTCPVLFFAASLGHQLAYEIDGLGSLTFGLLNGFKDTSIVTYAQLFKRIQEIYISKIKGMVTPVMTGDGSLYLFEPASNKAYAGTFNSQNDALFNELLTKDANFYVICIGITEYNISTISSGAFSNCKNDAETFADVIRDQFQRYNKGPNSKLHLYQLIDSGAKLKNIQGAINEVINKAGKNDFFFLSFAGFSSNGIDSNGQQELYFMPYSKQEIKLQADKKGLAEVPKEVLSLRRLRDLLIFVPCQNQLIVSEAGSTDNFTNLFTKAMIETSPSIMEIDSRNRVIIIPKEFGMDATNCNGKHFDNGPIVHFLQEIGKENSILPLFSQHKSVRQRKAYDFIKMETSCDFSKPYLEIFFERDILENLQFYLKDAQYSTSRSGKSSSKPLIDTLVSKHFNKKYALVIGTDNYLKGKPTWDNLSNPIADATEIGNLLKTVYRYEVVSLINPSANELIKALEDIALKLHPSDQFIFFVAGHGDYDSALFDDGFLVLSESLSKSNDPYRRTYLPFSTISNIIDNLNCNQALLIADVCFGGVFDRKLKTDSRSPNGIYDDLSLDKIIASKGGKRTRIVLTSGSINVVPDGYLGKHSPFAARLISALESGGGTRGILTTTQIFDMVQFLPSKPFKGELSGNEYGSEFFIISAGLAD